MIKSVILKESRNWWSCAPGIKWILENADYAFVHGGYHGNRVRIVTKKGVPWGDSGIQFNCFEFDNDRHGIIVTGESYMQPDSNPYRNDDGYVQTVGAGSMVMLLGFLTKWGASEFINPKRRSPLKWISDLCSRKKDKLIRVEYSLEQRFIKGYDHK